MEPWKSWAIVGVVGAGAAYYYTQSGKSKRGRGRAAATPADKDLKRALGPRNDSNDTRKKKGKGKASDASDQAVSDAADVSSASVQTSPSERAKKRKEGKQQSSKLAQSSAVGVSEERELDVGHEEEAEDEGMSNADFAKQLSQLKTGTSLTKPVTTNDTKKTRKQGKRNELPPENHNGSSVKVNGITSSHDMSTASSTTGADADDDLSLPVSPEFGATQATTPSGLDVSDMLEPPAKGPSVIRLTEPVNQQPARQPKAQRTATEPETKKQRQNRQKNEDKKAIREQAEKERRVLLEKQLRTAREAERRPAKNGAGVSNPPSTNAWSSSSGTAIGPERQPPASNNEALLDTFEETTSNANSNTNGLNGSGNNISVNEKAWNRDLPSEEEQMKLINDMESDNAWSTVPSGKGKKKATVASQGAAGADKAESSGSKKPSSTNFAPSSTDTQSPNYNNKDITSSSQAKTPIANSGVMASTLAKVSSDNEDTKAASVSKDGKPIVRTQGMTEQEYGMLFDSYDDYLKDWKKTKWSDGRLKAQDLDGPTAIRTKISPTGRKRVIKKRPRRPKANEESIDHSVWNSDNIKEHPDHDPDWPYGLVPHPLDSQWGSGGK